jgi:radical SAM superfamily enzyme YgiQ (UPF0313 family)
MLLVFPPVVKPCEPPAGIAKLSGALSAHGISHQVLDANLEGLLSLLDTPPTAPDTWTRRAVKNLAVNLAALRDANAYRSFDRYSRAVKDVNRVLAVSAKENGVVLGLADYQDRHLSPLRSEDLIWAAEHPERNPFYPYFKKRLPEILENSASSQRHQEGKEKNRDGEVEKTPHRMVGFSLNYLSQALCTFAMIGFLKREFPGVRVILGGGLVTSWMRRPGWTDPFGGLSDHLIAGRGEKALLSLLGVEGITRDHPTPSYESLPIHEYLAPGFILPYSGSSGCYWRKCSFCPEKAEDTPYVPVPIDQALADLTALTRKAKPVLLHLLDNALSPALMRALAGNPPGAPWYGFARFGREFLEIDYCRALKRSGCVMLKLGLESGDQGVLDTLEKGIDLETASQVLKNLKKAGIATYIYLLFGTPAETIAEVRKTLEFVVRHAEEISFLNLAIFNMPVGSRDAGEYETEQFYEGDLSLYTGFRHPRGWERKAVRQFLDTEFKRHPALSAILKRDPPVFTSNHAAFFANAARRRGVLLVD